MFKFQEVYLDQGKTNLIRALFGSILVNSRHFRVKIHTKGLTVIQTHFTLYIFHSIQKTFIQNKIQIARIHCLKKKKNEKTIRWKENKWYLQFQCFNRVATLPIIYHNILSFSTWKGAGESAEFKKYLFPIQYMGKQLNKIQVSILLLSTVVMQCVTDNIKKEETFVPPCI